MQRSAPAEGHGAAEERPASPPAPASSPSPGERRSSAGPVLFDDAVHAGAVRDVSHWVAAEVPDAAVTRLLVEPVGAAVPGVIGQSRHAAVR